MLRAIEEQLWKAEESLNAHPATIAKIILDSLALKYSSVIGTIETLTGRTIQGIHIVGGGSQNRYLNDATARATGRPVRVGPVEATVIGNVLVQAIAVGRFSNLAEARAHLAVKLSGHVVKTSKAKAQHQGKDDAKTLFNVF